MNISKMTVIVTLSLCGIFYFCVGASSQHEGSDAAASPNESIVGVIKHSPAEEYVVIEEVSTKTKRLYKRDIYEHMDMEGLKLIEGVSLEEIEYRYKPATGGAKTVSEDFELHELEEKRAVLKKAYVDSPEAPPAEETLAPEEDLLLLPEEASAQEEADPTANKVGAKRLVSSLFYKIESNKLSDTEWEISLPTALDAAANFGEVLGIVAEKIGNLISDEPEEETGEATEGESDETATQARTKVYLKSSLGKVSLGPKGLLIESLSSRMKLKSGLESDDVIKSVNGKSLTSIQAMVGAFSAFTGAAQTITVRILRDEEELTHTYYVR
ncbi:MAG: hypothetical protein ABH875_06910 [Candidatus Omnitrophota bacterium]